MKILFKDSSKEIIAFIVNRNETELTKVGQNFRKPSVSKIAANKIVSLNEFIINENPFQKDSYDS